MRSEFKKAARTIVPSRYELFHEAEQYEDNTAAAEHIKDGIKDLLEAGKFLRGGLVLPQFGSRQTGFSFYRLHTFLGSVCKAKPR
jgi:hypothetical protein